MSYIHYTRRAVVAAFAAACLMAGLQAPVLAQSVEEIKQRGTIRIGVFASEQPYGFIDEKGDPVGLDVDIAKLIAKEMGVEVTFEKVIQAARIPSLTTGKVDLLIASLNMLPERAKVIQFSRPYMGNMDIVAADKNLKISSYADLEQLRTAVARASAMDTALTQALSSSAAILRFDDDAAAVQAVLSGQADAFALGAFGLRRIQEANPGVQLERKFTMNTRWSGIGMRKGQNDLNAWVNAFLDKMEANGELGAITTKWLGMKFDYPEVVEDVPFTPNG